MNKAPLPPQIRQRVITVIVGASVLGLVFVSIGVVGLTRGNFSAAQSLGVIAIGLATVLVFLFLAYRLAHKARTDPDFVHRQPNAKATRILRTGNVTFGTIGLVIIRTVGNGWVGWVAGLGVGLVGSFAVFLLARRADPRLNFFRSIDAGSSDEERV